MLHSAHAMLLCHYRAWWIAKANSKMKRWTEQSVLKFNVQRKQCDPCQKKWMAARSRGIEMHLVSECTRSNDTEPIGHRQWPTVKRTTNFQDQVAQ